MARLPDRVPLAARGPTTRSPRSSASARRGRAASCPTSTASSSARGRPTIRAAGRRRSRPIATGPSEPARRPQGSAATRAGRRSGASSARSSGSPCAASTAARATSCSSCSAALGVFDLRPWSLHLSDAMDPTTIAAKRVFGIGDAMNLQRRASDLANAAGVPMEALDLGLLNWSRPEGERITAGVRDVDDADAPDGAAQAPARRAARGRDGRRRRGGRRRRRGLAAAQRPSAPIARQASTWKRVA